MQPKARLIWGKTDDKTGERLSLLDHSADVAACAVALLERTLLGRRLARLGGLDELTHGHRARLGYLAALHDLGKAGARFQRQLEPGQPKPGHVKPALALLNLKGGPYELSDRLHALLPGHLPIWSEDSALEDTAMIGLLTSTICHHGRPYNAEDEPRKADWAPTHGPDPFDTLAELLQTAATWFPDALLEGASLLPSATAFQHGWNGVLNLADWLGSSQDFFPFDGHSSQNLDRITFARQQAGRVLRWVGLDTTAARLSLNQAPQFSQVSDKPSPRPTQRATASVELPSSSSLMILEASTGSGKTEAALWHFARLFQAGLVDGMTFALPTRTAATQIERRLEEAMDRLFAHIPAADRPTVVLAVPGYLRVDGVEGKALPEFQTLWDDEDPHFRRRAWAGEHSKRYLAGGVVAGTVDQVLLSALQVKHAHLRAACELRHLLVVDEVHASDAYMTRVLQEVLKHHRAAGGHALLMSATLGASARRDLLDDGQPLPGLQDAAAMPYPLISWRDDGTGGSQVINSPSSEGDTKFDKHVIVELSPTAGDAQSIAARALDAARAGGRVLVVRNTVAECRAVQEALVEQATVCARQELLFAVKTDNGPVPAPHHGRFAPSDRRLLDRAIEEEFKPSAERQGGLVAVATQTVEQSLDIDADLLISDLCPMDVLLQRIGRLHRHTSTARAAEFEQAKVVVLTPDNPDLSVLLRESGASRGQHGLGGLVYPDLRVIEATWRQLRLHSHLNLPTMCRPLVEQSTHPEVLDTFDESLNQTWIQHAHRNVGKQAAERGVAKLNLVDWSKPFGEKTFGDEERTIATRLGDRDIVVPLEEEPMGPFGERVRQVTLRAYEVPTSEDSDLNPRENFTIDDLILNPGLGFSFALEGRTFTYDSTGLRQVIE